jgi:mono/diheme cytochrome c family protein
MMKTPGVREMVVAIGLALATGPATADPVLRGAALYDGTEALIASLPAMSGLRIQGATAACGRCHGGDARGLTEGGIAAPPIFWRALQTPSPGRPAYDAGSFRKAVTDGFDPAGRILHPAMPRYQMDDEQLVGLFAFLRRVASRELPGVTAEDVRIVVPHLRGEEFVPAILEALWAEPGRRAWGRRLRAVAVLLDPWRTDDRVWDRINAAAAVAGPSVRVQGLDATLAGRGLAHLFPIDTYLEAPASAILAEAPLAAQLAVLTRHAEALGGPVVRLCSSAAMPLDGKAGCAATPLGAKAVVLARPADVHELAVIDGGATVFAPLDHAAPLLRRAGSLPFPLVVADPRGRAMPRPVREELARIAPDRFARQPEMVRRLHAAAHLTMLAVRQAGPAPSAARIRSAAAALAPGEPNALLGPTMDGTRADAAYGMQLLRIEPGSADARAEGGWERP